MPSFRPASAPAALASPPPAAGSRLMERAKTVRVELHALFTARHQNLADIAHWLAVVKREQLFSYLGYASVYAYAYTEHVMGKSKVSELIGISNATESLPKIRKAFDAGQLDWTKAREISKVATPTTEAEWLAKAASSTAGELRAERKGEPAPRRRVLAFPEEAAALYDQLVAGAKQELGIVPDWQVVLELMKRGASGKRGEAPVQRVVITECPTCGEATTESKDGPVVVSHAALEQARCGGEVHDLREEDNVVRRAIPTKVKRRVFDRDRRRCVVPGCRAMSALEAHHAKGWKNGHDADHLLTLCWSHHRAVHKGLLRIEGAAQNLRFVRLDGAQVGEPMGAQGRQAAVACENAAAREIAVQATAEGEATNALAPRADREGVARGETAVAPEETERRSVEPSPPNSAPPQAERDPVRDAILALQSLGLRTGEANRFVQVALDTGGDRPWTAGDLAGAALRAS